MLEGLAEFYGTYESTLAYIGLNSLLALSVILIGSRQRRFAVA